MAISRQITDALLRIDLIGIGVMIFMLTLTAVHAGYHNYPTARNSIMGSMLFLFVSNGFMQCTSCYQDPKNDWLRTGFFVFVLIICLGLAIAWFFFYATNEEAARFTPRLALSFLALLFGFIFFRTKWPERQFRRNRCI